MKQGIIDFQIGETFDGFLLLKNVSKGTTSAGKPVLTLILVDQTGAIEAKLWDSTEEDEKVFVPEEIVKITGRITEFRGMRQLTIQEIRPHQPTDGVNVSQFIKTAPISKEELNAKINEAIFEMSNPNIQRIVRSLVEKYREQILTYPAAVMNHHEYASGLAHHIVSMLALAEKIYELYPQLNKDLLYAGIILHDLGKVKELSGVVSTSYTMEGKLLGHIPIMIEEIGETARQLNIDGEEVLLLKHLVLCHNQKPEWGSPTPHLVQEAEILDYIDMIDRKVNMLNRHLRNVEPGEFTERIFAMDNRSFYKPTFE